MSSSQWHLFLVWQMVKWNQQLRQSNFGGEVGGSGGGCSRFTRRFCKKFHFLLILLAAFNHRVTNRVSLYSCFSSVTQSFAFVTFTHNPFPPTLDCELIAPLLRRNWVLLMKKKNHFYLHYCEAESFTSPHPSSADGYFFVTSSPDAPPL